MLGYSDGGAFCLVGPKRAAPGEVGRFSDCLTSRQLPEAATHTQGAPLAVKAQRAAHAADEQAAPQTTTGLIAIPEQAHSLDAVPLLDTQPADSAHAPAAAEAEAAGVDASALGSILPHFQGEPGGEAGAAADAAGRASLKAERSSDRAAPSDAQGAATALAPSGLHWSSSACPGKSSLAASAQGAERVGTDGVPRTLGAVRGAANGEGGSDEPGNDVPGGNGESGNDVPGGNGEPGKDVPGGNEAEGWGGVCGAGEVFDTRKLKAARASSPPPAAADALLDAFLNEIDDLA